MLKFDAVFHNGSVGRRDRALLLSPLLLALTFCGAGRAQSTTVRPPTAQAPATDTANAAATADRLYATLWVDAAPEYQALCWQTFNSARRAVEELIEEAPRKDGLVVGAQGKPLAVVADLDETILDNSGYQAELVLEEKQYTAESWKAWVERVSGVRLVPGAGRFIQQMEEMGVTMIYLSNRLDSNRAFTMETLRRLGVNVEGLENRESHRLLLRTEESDKTPRRLLAAQQYEVIAYLGDNLGDFPGMLVPEITDRHDLVEGAHELWGVRWFVFPNPTYGSWVDTYRGQDLREVLRRLTESEKRN